MAEDRQEQEGPEQAEREIQMRSGCGSKTVKTSTVWLLEAELMKRFSRREWTMLEPTLQWRFFKDDKGNETNLRIYRVSSTVIEFETRAREPASP